MLNIITLRAQCGMTGFESPAAEYKQSDLDLSELLIQHPEATYACFAEGDSIFRNSKGTQSEVSEFIGVLK